MNAKIQIPPPSHVKFTNTGRAYAEMETLVEGGLYEKIKEAVVERRRKAASATNGNGSQNGATNGHGKGNGLPK